MSLAGEPGFDTLIWRLVDGAVQFEPGELGELRLIPETRFRERAASVLDGLGLSIIAAERDEALQIASDDVYRYGPLTGLMQDKDVTDIVVNAPDLIFVDRGDGLRPSPVSFRSREHLGAFATQHLGRVGKVVNRATPIADAELSDGSRLHVAAPPIAEGGVVLAIRRFRASMRLDTLVASGMIDPLDAERLRAVVHQRRNLMIAGGPGAGKTTLLGALLSEVDPAQRIVGVEDVPELRPHHPHYVRLLTRRSTTASVAHSGVGDLVREALRMRPDRLVVGEVRGPEALDMVSAMTTGMDGSMTTIHASSVAGALARLGTLLRIASGSGEAERLAREAIDLVIFIRRGEDGRRRIEAMETV